jgi:hypothetical protein
MAVKQIYCLLIKMKVLNLALMIMCFISNMSTMKIPKTCLLLSHLYQSSYMFSTWNKLKTAEQIYVKFCVGKWFIIFSPIPVLITVEQQ